jgi:chemotaxis protein MotB
MARKPKEQPSETAAEAIVEPASAQAEPAATPKPEAAPALQPIIVKKIIVEEGHAGHHGGAWKIALADMMTAMMAFFLLMWLLGATNEDKRKSVADYFRPASHSQIVFGELAGSNGLFGGKSIIDTEGFPFTAKQTALLERLTPQAQGGPSANDDGAAQGEAGESGEGAKKSDRQIQDTKQFEEIQKSVQKKLESMPQFQNIKNQVSFTMDKDGLRIDVLDKADFSMFQLGTSEPTPRAALLLQEIGKSISEAPNKISIRGHTDSLGFVEGTGGSNWTLSAERADSTRKLIQSVGIPGSRFAKIEGVADTEPFIKQNPADPRNRRVSITLLNQ